MKKLIEQIKSHRDFYTFALYFIILMLIIVIVILANKSFSNDEVETVSNVGIKEMIDSEDTGIVYVYTSDENKCSFCASVGDYLQSQDISYYSYDIKNIDGDTYTELLELLDIDKDVFGYPALFYLKKGKVYANLINIDNTKVVESFISEFDLNLL